MALDYDARAADHNHLGYNEHDTVLIAQLTGQRKATPARGRASTPSDMYAVPHRRQTTHVVSLPLVWETPLRTGNLRDPDGPQVTFASESFIDELAAAAKADPAAFRLPAVHGHQRGRQRLQAGPIDCRARGGAEGLRVGRRGRRRSRAAAGEILTGRGLAYAFRSQTVAAQIVEVEVNRTTGRVWAKRIVCAHDCGLVINPEALRRTLECGMLHSLSRALHEEVRFDTQKVTSVDWARSPTLTHADTPGADRHRPSSTATRSRPREDLPHYGAGETVCKPMLAAVANAIFDATGVRLRRVPFRRAARARGAQGGEGASGPMWTRRQWLRPHGIGARGLAASAGTRAPAGPAVDGPRLQRRLEQLSTFGRPAGGSFASGVSRVAYSDADVAARAWLLDEIRAAGFSRASIRPATSSCGWVTGRRPPILFGSHIDSVPERRQLRRRPRHAGRARGACRRCRTAGMPTAPSAGDGALGP